MNNERHQYVRLTMQMWVQWFAFFITANYVGLGWFGIARDQVLNVLGTRAKWVIIVFLIQIVLGLWISFELLGRVARLEKALLREGADDIKDFNAIAFYKHGIIAAIGGLMSVAVLWIALIIMG